MNRTTVKYVQFIPNFVLSSRCDYWLYELPVRGSENICPIQNMTQLKTEMVRSEVFQLYINQDVDNRLRLEQKMSDMEKNNSVLQVLYEDALQQQEQLKATVATQAQEIRQLALALLGTVKLVKIYSTSTRAWQLLFRQIWTKKRRSSMA